MKPLAIDLFCGLGGWAEGLLAEGFLVVGFDIERHDYGTGGYPGQLVIQDVTTLHGSQFKNAAVIVASPPCQAYSYRAMPWKRAKALPPPDNTLFETCFRIQREACEAAGRYIPMIVENVRGAQPWVGKARAWYGSYYLWGDVGMVGRRVVAGVPRFGVSVQPMRHGGAKAPPGNASSPMWKDREISRTGAHATPEEAAKLAAWIEERDAQKRNPDGTDHPSTKVPGLNWSDYGDPDYKPKGFNVTAAQRYREGEATKGGGDWFGSGENCSIQRRHGSKSNSRKAASAMIAKIPFPLAHYIAKTFSPERLTQ